MSWQCRLITEEEEKTPEYSREFGHMKYAPSWHGYDLSPEYTRDWKDKRPPILVWIPEIRGDGKLNGRFFCVDQKYSGKENGWTVTGEAPNITLSPSINSIGSYHGWLQNGVLSDDVEGRKF